ncbi:hypothetical protein [Nocardia canadensis]|uniref:hypothetical protein n=1 Tax=Nocardia canadensis TaxID=3065238 RepID=UPI00292EDC75|nr:hypothetical protein [Nocardia canadensis]
MAIHGKGGRMVIARMLRNSVAILIGGGILLSGAGPALAAADVGAFGSSELVDAGTGSARSGISLGAQIVSSGSAAASDASKLLSQLVESGGAVVSGGSSVAGSMLELLASWVDLIGHR